MESGNSIYSELTSAHSETAHKYFPGFDSVASTVLPGSFIWLGDHTHYNEGLSLAGLVDRGVYCSLALSGEQKTRIILESEKTEFEIDLDSVCTSMRCEVVRKAYNVLKEEGYIDKNINVVINYNIPECFGLGLYSALVFVFTKTVFDAFNVDYDKELLLKTVKQIEINSVGKISNSTHHHNFYNQFKGSLLKMDLRTRDASPLEFDYENYKLLVVDTGKTIPDVRETCNSRIEECEVGVKGLKLYVWGIKSLRDVNHDFLQKHINMIPRRVYSRVLFNVTERERVEEAINAISNNEYSRLNDITNQSHESLKTDYDLNYNELNFLQSVAISLEGVIGSKLVSCSPIKSTYNIVHKDKVENFKENITKRYLEKFNKGVEIFELNFYS